MSESRPPLRAKPASGAVVSRGELGYEPCALAVQPGTGVLEVIWILDLGSYSGRAREGRWSDAHGTGGVTLMAPIEAILKGWTAA